jgi:ATP-dependent RNA helicase RhlE
MPEFKKLALNPNILKSLERKGYTKPTPIQSQSIPHIIDGKDLLGIAQTGTGKTAAFSLPLLHNLAKNSVRVSPNHIRSLVLTPTRELASQIVGNIDTYGKELGFKHATVFGGVGEYAQIKNLSRGLDILVATPGRLLDLTNQGYVKYNQLEILVLDEADRMLDLGFVHDIKKIIAKLPKQRQTLFFSATMPRDIADLAHSILKHPVKVEITPQATTVEKIDQKVYLVDKSNKPLLLKHLLTLGEVTRMLVFSKTKHGANKIVEFLEREGVKVSAIHGNKSQTARESALRGFRSGLVKVLVATDIAARGIDVPEISHVVNFDLPLNAENYVHRIGRTARAGKSGIAITFCDKEEKQLLRTVERTIRFNIPVDTTHPFHGVAPRIQEKEASSHRHPRGDFNREFKGGGKGNPDRRNSRKPFGKSFSSRKRDS